VLSLQSDDGKECLLVKRTFFAIFQVFTFFLEYFKRNGRFELNIIQTGWPGSKWRNRFLTIGELILPENDLFVSVEGCLYPLSQCPQREFFTRLDQNEGLSQNRYYLLAKTTLDESEFNFWLETRRSLLLTFNDDGADFTPIVTKTARGLFVVQDGAHRLALKSLRGSSEYRVKISIWTLGVLTFG
jgi:hypothetical protein